ncbi:receptor-type tyrosine-protein phosphatase kappa isoform X2 [Tribolium castaneum]
MIIHSKTNNGLWKIHNVTYMYTNKELNYNEFGPPIETFVKNSVCLSMYISMCTSCKITLTLDEENSPSYKNSKQFFSEGPGWFQIRFIMYINPERRARFLVSTTGSETERYWAVDKVRLCQENEFRKIGLSESASCQLMSDENTTSLSNKNVLSESTCPENTIGKFCVPCGWIYNECKQVKVCTFNDCTCSAGYIEANCNDKCRQGTYGHGCRNKCGNCNNGCDKINGTCSNNKCNENFFGPKCDKRSTVTFRKAPMVINITYTSATVNLTSFEVENDLGIETAGYLFQYKEAEDKSNKWANTNLINFGQIAHTTIDHLKADTKYFVRAVIKSANGTIYSEYIESFNVFTTKCKDVTEEQIVVTPLNTSATVSIQRAQYTCRLFKYKIIVAGVGKGTILNESVFFDKLNPFTHYTLKVITSSTSSIEKKFQTIEGVPQQISDLIIINNSETSIDIKWPKPKLINGQFKNYVVEYQRVSSLACNQSFSAPTSKNTFTTTGDSTRIQKLTPYSNYSISVFVTNSKFKGPPQIKHESTMSSNIIKMNEVPKISEIKTSHYRARIMFSETRCDEMNGPLWYQMAYNCTSPWCLTTIINTFTIKYDREKNYYDLHDLKAFTNYKLQIKYCRNKNCANYVSEYSEFKTKPSKPFKIRDLLVYSKNGSSVSLRWRPPYPPTGDLKEYRINDNYRSYSETLKREMTECKLWPEFHCVDVTNLNSNKQYTFEVAGKNHEPNDFGPTESVTTTTKTEKSQPPYDLQMKWTPKNDLELEWKHPNATNGEIKYFSIRLFSMSDAGFLHNLTINNYNLTYHFKLNSDEIQPTTSYRLQIAACNERGEGEFLTGDNTSPPDVPKVDLHTESSNETITVKFDTNELRGKTDSLRLLLFISEKSGNAKLENNIVTGLQNLKLVSNCTSNSISFKSLTIGNNQQSTHCTQMDNPPLKPGTPYNITVVLINYFNQTNRTNLFTISTTTKSTSIYAGPNLNLLALLVLLLAIPLIVLYFKRHAILSWIQRIQREDTNEIPDVKDDQIPLTGLTPQITQTRNPRNEAKPKIPSKCIKIMEFEMYVKESIQSGELDRQHALFPRGQTKPWNYGSLKENKSKNRYNNLIAYDHSRVILQKIKGDSYSDYINASYIDGHKISKAYIATQGPKAVTLNDFWRMVWEQNVMHIANLANVYEGGKKKVEKYWPDINETLQFGTISVQHLSTQVFADYEHRFFSVCQNNEIRKIDQLHFMSWPDHGVPLYSQSLVPFLQKLLKFPLSTYSPIVVHCSAGVGRTGTILLCDICLRMAAREGTIDVLRNLEHLRQQRANMVDNIEQYKLAHLVILECLVGMHTSIGCTEIKDSVNRILANGTATLQMRYLKNTQWQDQAMKTVAQIVEEVPIIEEKNRFKGIIPEIQGRVFLSRFPSEDETSSYINAVKVDGFRSPGRFIVTQQPMPNTLGDFWRLVEENDIRVILSLNDVNLKNKTSCRFWPTRSNPEMTPVPHITLKYLKNDLSESYNITTVQLIANSRKEQFSVQIISVKHWTSGNNCPDNIGNFLTFWQESDAISRRSNPILVTCYDGVTASGLYVALSFVIEKMNLEQVCDVCQAVRSVRHNREQFVQNVEQFEFLYKAALLYIDRFESYANFN